MGSAFSLMISSGNASKDPPAKPGLGDLPESCVASVLLYLDPPEICRLAMLNRAFRGASSADFIWESKLPLNYDSVIQRVYDDGGVQENGNCGFPEDLCKKDIYSRLCRTKSFDGGAKVVWLDKGTGKFCLSISSGAGGLAITGIDDRRYWSRLQTEESRFRSVAYLQQTWWFEVDGDFEFPFTAGTYSLFFRLQLGKTSKRFGRRVCNTEHVHGWDVKPVRFQLSTSDGQNATSQCYIKEPGKWTCYHAGDFTVVDPSTPTKVKFSMTQIDCTHTKGGLCVDSVCVYPSEFKEKLLLF
ncbi:OLC1v1029560C1 [Oldenlandia corymbosa var. corymbosa]|uniref:OLC1v1029560C1 n=1 Tax=Oldenlandia corymbosa var. corymbosa TaxID=529605 RepID=A0AAV1CEF2_OLDCO|nr:OLC1v1029560C1 [Oldenlandia corymbosa var. corymbosa]